MPDNNPTLDSLLAANQAPTQNVYAKPANPTDFAVIDHTPEKKAKAQIHHEIAKVPLTPFTNATREGGTPASFMNRSTEDAIKAQQAVMQYKLTETEKQRKKFDADIDTELRSRAAKELIKDPRALQHFLKPKPLEPQDFATQSTQDAVLQHTFSQEDGLSRYLDAYVQANKPKLLTELEERKKVNLDNLSKNMSDMEFRKLYDVDGTLHKIAAQHDDPASWLKGGSGRGEDNTTPVGQIADAMFTKGIHRDDIMSEDGRVNPEYKKQVLTGAMNNPFDLYYANPNNDKVRGKDKRFNINHGVGLATANALTDKMIVDQQQAKAQWTQVMNGIDQWVDNYHPVWVLNPMNPMGETGLKQAVEYNEEFAKGAAKIGAFGATLLEWAKDYANPNYLFGTEDKPTFGQLLYPKIEKINEIIPAEHQEYAGSLGKIVDGVSRMLGEFGAGAGLGSVGLGKLVEPLASKATTKLYTKLAENVLPKATAEAAGSTTATIANRVLSASLSGLQSGSVGYATKFADRFIGMMTTGGAQMYADAYDQAKKAGFDDATAAKKATSSTITTSLFLSMMGNFLSSATKEERDILKDLMSEKKAPTEITPTKNWLTTKGQQIGKAWENSFDETLTDFGKRMAVNPAKAAVEFTTFNTFEELKRQKEEFDAKKEKGEIAPDSAFRPDMQQVFESAKEGAKMGGLLGIISTVVGGHGKAPSDPRADAIANIMSDPQSYERMKDAAMRRGKIPPAAMEQADAFLNTIRPYYVANAKKAFTMAGAKEPRALTPTENAKLSIEQARLSEAKKMLSLFDTQQVPYDPVQIAKLRQAVAASQRTVRQLSNGTYLRDKAITNTDIARLVGGKLRGDQEKRLRDNGPYTVEEADVNQFKNDADVQNYLSVHGDADTAKEYLDARDKVQTELNKYRQREKMGVKLSVRDTQKMDDLEKELADLNKQYSSIKGHTDIVGFENTDGLAPVVDKNGEVIDGKKRIAKAIADGETKIEVARPLTIDEIKELHKDIRDDAADGDAPAGGAAPSVEAAKQELTSLVTKGKDQYDENGKKISDGKELTTEENNRIKELQQIVSSGEPGNKKPEVVETPQATSEYTQTEKEKNREKKMEEEGLQLVLQPLILEETPETIKNAKQIEEHNNRVKARIREIDKEFDDSQSQPSTKNKIDGETLLVSIDKNDENYDSIEEAVKGKNFVKQTVNIDELVAKDKDLQEYLKDNKETKGRKVEKAIIVGDITRGGETQKGGVIDGFHRIAQAIANGETEIDAYVEQPTSDPIAEARALYDSDPENGLELASNYLKGIAKNKSEHQRMLMSVSPNTISKAIAEGMWNNAGTTKAEKVVREAVIPRLKKAFLSIGTKIYNNAAEMMQALKNIGEDNVQYNITMPDGSSKTVRSVGADVVNGFYSPLEKTINETKFDKLPAKQWLDKFGKSEEAKWTGLSEWLSQQEGSVSKGDVKKFLKDNRIEVVEVVKGETFEDKGFSFGKTASGEYYFKHEGEDIATAYGMKSKSPIDAFKEWVEDNGGVDEVSDFYNIPKEDFFISEIRQHGELGSEVKFQQYQLEGDKSNYKEWLIINPKVDYTDPHWEEKGIAVWLRGNIRKDAEGKKVFFLEEIQSGHGQKGKKEGFAVKKVLPEDVKILSDEQKYYDDEKGDYRHYVTFKVKGFPDTDGVSYYPKIESKQQLIERLAKLYTKYMVSQTPSAPFVTDTNAWTKLGLKVALKEAVKQGEQMQRTAFEKLVDKKMDWVEARMKKLGKLEIKCP